MKFVTFTSFDGKAVKISPVTGISLIDSTDHPGGTIIYMPSTAYVVTEPIEVVETKLKRAQE